MTDDTATPTPDDVAHAFYGSTESVVGAYGSTLQDDVNRLRDSTGMSAEDGAAHTALMAEAFYDAGIDTTEAGTIHATLTRYLLEPADARTVQEWERETRQVLRERFGDQADKRMALARHFIEARPELKQRFNESGVGSHPRVVVALAERANTLRMRPAKPKNQ